jgi:serine/threonine protein kinase/Flp pilus assembly protein TadD
VTPTPFASLSAELAHRVEAFEDALARDPAADFARFLPDHGHPLYRPLLGEYIRIDLEHAWTRGRPRRLTEYAANFPAVLEQVGLLRAVAFEEYRQRRRAGEAATPAEYLAAYGIDTADWPLIDPGSVAGPPIADEDLARTNIIQTPMPGGTVVVNDVRPADAATDHLLDGHSVSQWVKAAESLPEPGTAFLGFRLVEELGRGAFGRVYLARQADLAGRSVALKVSADLGVESQTLAQLQHTNIVPIYSFHRVGPFQAVCMPYFGRTTLAQVLDHISNRPSLPCSGRELRSTLDRAKDDTLPVNRSGLKSAPAPGTPEAAPEPAAPETAPPPPVGHAPDGWARMEGMSYVEAVLTLGAELADGLAHAHARGILHRDLKPANVLLTDEGRPMLLDFNLAEDIKQRTSAERAAVGGTLPYMAPEHIEAFGGARHPLDARCDLYSLGVILFELLTGRHPFPVRKGSAREVVFTMLMDRRKPAPSLRQHNPAISPGVESIVRKCLAADAADRYQSAEQLREDIDRHLANRRLRHAPDPSPRERARKWARRHPRLASSGTVAAVAAVLLVALGGGAVYSRERARDLEARGRLADHQTAFRDAQVFLDDQTRSWPRLDEGLGTLRGVLARYGVPEEPGAGDDWLAGTSLRYLPEADRERVKGDVGETFYLMAQVAYQKAFAATDPAERAAQVGLAIRWNERASRYAGSRIPRAVREQRAALAALGGDRTEGERLQADAAAITPETPRDRYLFAAQKARRGQYRQSLGQLEEATRLDPENFSAWFVRGWVHLMLEQSEQAAACFGACVALRPDHAGASLNHGLAFARMRMWDLALVSYDRAVRLDPALAEAYIERARAYEQKGKLPEAIADYTRALETGASPTRVYFLRALARDRSGDAAGARADREAGFRLTPTDELSWIARAENRLGDDPKGALADTEAALKLNPLSVFGLQLKAHILAERMNRPADAIKVLDRAVEAYPDYVPARAGRGVLLARTGKRDEAIRDAKDALLSDTRAPNLYQVGCIYALTARTHPEDRTEALRLLWGGLKTGFGLDIVDSDPDLDPIRDDPEFRRMVARAKSLRRD